MNLQESQRVGRIERLRPDIQKSVDFLMKAVNEKTLSDGIKRNASLVLIDKTIQIDDQFTSDVRDVIGQLLICKAYLASHTLFSSCSFHGIS